MGKDAHAGEPHGLPHDLLDDLPGTQHWPAVVRERYQPALPGPGAIRAGAGSNDSELARTLGRSMSLLHGAAAVSATAVSEALELRELLLRDGE